MSFVICTSVTFATGNLAGIASQKGIVLIDNSAGAKTLMLTSVEFRYGAALTVISDGMIFKNCTVGSLSEHTEISAHDMDASSSTAVDLMGGKVYEWDTTGDGIEGITKGPIVHGDRSLGGINRTVEFDGGLKVPPGAAVSISAGASGATNGFVVVKGRVMRTGNS